MQQFFATPKYNKKSIYKNPETQYHHFTNAFGYYRMIQAENPSYPKKNLYTEATEAWKLVKKKKKNEIDDKIREYLTTPIPIQSYVSRNSNQVSSVQETISMSSITIVVDETMVTTHKKSEHMKQKQHKRTTLSNSLDDFSLSLTSTTPETNNRGCVSDD
ncbi:17528_t:CDS:2, partial [Gigaspora rosea]